MVSNSVADGSPTTLECEKADLWRLHLHPRAADVQTLENAGRAAHVNTVRQWLLWDELAERERENLRATARHLPPPLSQQERRAWLESTSLIVMSSDGYIPFPDNVDRAARSGVRVIAQPGGSKQDAPVTPAADAAGIATVHNGVRLFWH